MIAMTCILVQRTFFFLCPWKYASNIIFCFLYLQIIFFNLSNTFLRYVLKQDILFILLTSVYRYTVLISSLNLKYSSPLNAQNVHVSVCHHIKHHQEITHFQLSIVLSEEVRLCTCVCIWVYINHSARIFKAGNHWKDSNPSCPTTVQTTFITSGHSFTTYPHEIFF